MRRTSASVVALIIIAVIFFAGEAYAYLPSDRGFSSSITQSDSGIDYSMNANGAYVGSSVLMDNDDMQAVDELYIYRDTDYKSNVDENQITATGSQVFTQSYYIDQLTKNLKFRGMTNVAVMDSNELYEKLNSDIAASAKGKGLVIISGAIPDNIFGVSHILEDWISDGGYLFWAGNEIGKYASNTTEAYEVNRQIDLIGTDQFSYSTSSACQDTAYRSIFCYESQQLCYSPDITSVVTASEKLGTGFTDDGRHNSVTFVGKGNGQICICAGSFSSQQIHDMAISICSGICYKTSIVDRCESEFNRNMTGSYEMPISHGNLSIYISIGKYHCAYAQRYDL